ncbi:MAG TPA: hypothetical protein VFT10_06745 [Solirubrobacterales bacterium]|nr:hypothetical protein [Solirubrobacterales bacterium]
MRRKLTSVAVAASLAVAAFGATGASAATEFGDNCIADDSTEGTPVTLFALTAFGNPLPLTAPSGGVITKWKSTLVPAPVSIPQTLKVLRQTGANTVLIVGESTGSITGGTNTFDTRIPIQTGDRLGLFGSPGFGNLICNAPGPENGYAGFEGGGAVGQTVPFVSGLTAEARFPVFAVLEPDADNDGFGDETQDLCPQLASVQTACPVATLNATGNARKGLATVLVTATSQAPVTVTGTVKLGKGKTAKLNGGSQVVQAGTISKFTLLFPKKLKEKLKGLSRKASLKLSVTASATDLVGRVSSDSLNLRLKGQKKPKGKG